MASLSAGAPRVGAGWAKAGRAEARIVKEMMANQWRRVRMGMGTVPVF
jgi:hypothetical protein